jgi:hypothetical protein
MNLTYQELNKMMVEGLENEFICYDCGSEYGNTLPIEEVQGKMGKCCICDDITKLYESKVFF